MSKASGRRFGPYKQRTIPSQPSVASQLQVDYSSMDHREEENGISLCVLWMWYQLQCTRRDSWTRNRKRHLWDVWDAWVCSKNRMWLMQFSQEVVQCQKRLSDVLDPINREPSPHSLQFPANFRGGGGGGVYSSLDHSKKEDGISLCVLWMWYRLQRTRRD